MKVLAVGCHPDDLEIACSGTLRKYVEQVRKSTCAMLPMAAWAM